jgi:plastocyanin
MIGILAIGSLACGGGEPEAPAGGAPPAGATEATPAADAGGGYEAAPAADAGRISGRVAFEGTPPPAEPIQITKDKSVCGAAMHTSEKLVVGKDSGIRYAVVSIDPVKGGKAFETGTTPQLDQRGCWFSPHVQVVPAGVEIEILNNDGILHNIHTFPEKNKPINMAQPKFRKVLKASFPEPDVVRVSCDVHSWMNAWIIVAAHPYYAVTAEDGSFELDSVPPGTYTLTTWHESLGTKTQSITLEASGAAEASVTFGG